MSDRNGPAPGPGPRLGAEALATLMRVLQYYLEYEREFVTMFFPEIVERGYVASSDVAELTARQADALRPLLADSVRYFRRQEAKQPSRRTPSTLEPTRDDAERSSTSKKARLWANALQELCLSFGLRNPLEDERPSVD